MTSGDEITNAGATLTPHDYVRFRDSELAIYNLMLDGQWHRAQEIIEASGIREGMRRLRALRQKPGVEGVDCRRVAGESNEYEYQMRLAPRTMVES